MSVLVSVRPLIATQEVAIQPFMRGELLAGDSLGALESSHQAAVLAVISQEPK